MNDLIHIQKIDHPEVEIFSSAPLKIIQNEKGKAVFLNATTTVHTVAMLQFLPHAGIRGNHYHKTKREALYVVEGKMKLYYWLPQSPKVEEALVETGHLVAIEPGLAHAYQALEKTWAFEMGSHVYDPDDTVYDPDDTVYDPRVT